MIDSALFVTSRPEFAVHEIPTPTRELASDPWVDFIAAYKARDPWLAWIGHRSAAAPVVRTPTPEELVRESRGGIAAPRTIVGLVYRGRLRASMPASRTVRTVSGLYLVFQQWDQFMLITRRQDIQFFVGLHDVDWKPEELIPSERWADDRLPPEDAVRVRTLLAGASAPSPPRVAQPERVIIGDTSRGGCVPIRVEGGPADGAVGVVCGTRPQKAKPCITCGAPSTRLCDAPLGETGRRTCSAPMCDAHVGAHREGLDLCTKHAVTSAAPLPQTKELAKPAAKKTPPKKPAPPSSDGGQLGMF